MRRAVLLLSIPLALLAYETAEQTDWSGGDEVPGPVTDWEDTFDTSANINWSGFPGELELHRVALDIPIEHLVADWFRGAHCVYAADVDGDNDIDVLGAAYADNEITWWENLDGSGTSWTEHIVDGGFTWAVYVYAADMDGDDDIDVLGSAWLDREIAWWENLNGLGTAWMKHTVDSGVYFAMCLYAADVDGDDDIDVLGAAYYDDDIAWWENLDGLGTTWTEHTVDGDFDSAHSVYAADVDGDDDIDVLGAAPGVDDITWWENLDGSGTSWTEHTVDTNFDGAISVYAADVDGDDDIDVLGAAWVVDDITWWENLDGSGTTWTEHTVDGNFDGATHVYAADVDGDGDRDVLGANVKEITWWENLDGSGTTWTEHTVDGNFDGAVHVYAADVDGDNDLDVLGAAIYTHYITWWEVTRFADIGRLTASILDTGDNVGWGVVEWIDDVPDDTSLSVEARASDNPGAMGDWVAVTEGDLSDYLPDGLRYLQYRVTLDTDDNDVTPTFNWIRFSWSDDAAVEDVELFVSAVDDGILIDWTIQGDVPIGLLVLREVDGVINPLHGEALPGSAKRYLDRDVTSGIEYRYWLEVIEEGGIVSCFGPTEAVRIEPERLVLWLSDPYPSPAGERVTLAFSLPSDSHVELAVYDLAGRHVATLVSGEFTAGRHEVSWDSSTIPSGVYLYNLVTDKGSLTKRLVVGR